MYSENDIKNIVDRQRDFFHEGKTLDVDWRLRQLYRLKKAVLDNRQELERALYEDLARASL